MPAVAFSDICPMSGDVMDKRLISGTAAAHPASTLKMHLSTRAVGRKSACGRHLYHSGVAKFYILKTMIWRTFPGSVRMAWLVGTRPLPRAAPFLKGGIPRPYEAILSLCAPSGAVSGRV